MKLPNYENAFIDQRKLIEYALNEFHPIGKHKAIVFKNALGITKENASELEKIILEGIRTYDAIEGELDEFGKRFIVFIPVTDQNNQLHELISAWIIKTNESYPRLVTCYLK